MLGAGPWCESRQEPARQTGRRSCTLQPEGSGGRGCRTWLRGLMCLWSRRLERAPLPSRVSCRAVSPLPERTQLPTAGRRPSTSSTPWTGGSTPTTPRPHKVSGRRGAGGGLSHGTCRPAWSLRPSVSSSSRASRVFTGAVVTSHLSLLLSTEARRGHSVGPCLPVRTWPESELSLLLI